MALLFQSVKILNTQGIQNEVLDLVVDEGKIIALAKNIPTQGHEVIEAKGWVVSIGWKDCFTVVNVPGNEHKETALGLSKSAVAGGYTDVLLISGGAHPLDAVNELNYVQQQFQSLPIKAHLTGTVSENQKGKEITEMYEMYTQGFKVFCDGIQNLDNPELLKRALLYTEPFGGKVMVYSENTAAAHGGMVNESKATVGLGMKTRAALAEEIELVRNIYIAEYTNAPLHCSGISSEKAVEIIKAAKKKGLKITADTHIANLYFTDEVLEDFESKYKLLPVLRTEKDRKALLKGVQEGVIDLVVSGHHPQDLESKDCEFDLAAFGGVTLQSTAGALWKLFKGDEKAFYHLMVVAPSNFLNLALNEIKVGNPADLSFFKLEEDVCKVSTLKSTVKTSPFTDEIFPIKIMGTYVKGKFNPA